MATNYLVTGYTGSPVSASIDAHLHAGLVGPGSYVTTVGQQLACQLVDANTLRIQDGSLFFQGLFACIPTGSYEEVSIDSGEQGKQRIDLIGFQYAKDTVSGRESGTFVAVKGTATTGTPEVPVVPAADLLAGATEAFFPLYRVPIQELVPSTPEALFATVSPLSNESTEDDIPAENYTSFDSSAFSGSVLVEKKSGVCYIVYNLTRKSSTTSWTQILSNDKVPAPESHIQIYQTTPCLNDASALPLDVTVYPYGGGLLIMGGTVGKNYRGCFSYLF